MAFTVTYGTTQIILTNNPTTLKENVQAYYEAYKRSVLWKGDEINRRNQRAQALFTLVDNTILSREKELIILLEIDTILAEIKAETSQPVTSADQILRFVTTLACIEGASGLPFDLPLPTDDGVKLWHARVHYLNDPAGGLWSTLWQAIEEHSPIPDDGGSGETVQSGQTLADSG